LCTLGSFVKITEVCRAYFRLFFPRFRLGINFGKNLLGYILGDFFLKLTHLVTLETFRLWLLRYAMLGKCTCELQAQLYACKKILASMVTRFLHG
jgi:hypothetical protein